MSGNSSLNQQGFYGDKGVTTSSNIPANRHSAVSWRDNDGNLWLFGGESNLLSGNKGNANLRIAITLRVRIFQ
jgi:hypothetical protein